VGCPNWGLPPPRGDCGRRLLEFDYEFELDRSIERQDSDTDCASCVTAGIPENLDESVARAIRDAGLTGEVWFRSDEDNELHNARDAVNRSNRRLNCR
jgi:hypothetical protein